MRNNFNSVQMFETSDVCNKFSTRFLYKNLVGGTTTTGRECVQNQRLSEGSAEKPLSAVGTLTSLLCNSAKVVEKLFYRHSEPKAKNPKNNIQDWILHFAFAPFRMTFPVLAMVLSMGVLSESRAASCIFSEDGTKVTITGSGNETFKDMTTCNSKNSIKSGEVYTPDSNWRNIITDLTIGTGIVNIKNYAFAWASNLNSVSLSDSVTTIGHAAFYMNTSVTDITIPNSVTKIESSAFNGATNLTHATIPNNLTDINDYAFQSTAITSISIPESVTHIGNFAFAFTTNVRELIIPDTWDDSDIDISSNIFYNSCVSSIKPKNCPSDTKIICKGDIQKCKSSFAKYGNANNIISLSDYQTATDKSTLCTNGNKSGIYEWINNKCQRKSEVACNKTEKYYYNGSTCINRPSNGKITCVNPSYKANDGYCDRIRYTPAEAAEVLRNDNTNEVTITFKQ